MHALGNMMFKPLKMWQKPANLYSVYSCDMKCNHNFADWVIVKLCNIESCENMLPFTRCTLIRLFETRTFLNNGYLDYWESTCSNYGTMCEALKFKQGIGLTLIGLITKVTTSAISYRH